MIRLTGMNAKADEAGFIVVYPYGTERAEPCSPSMAVVAAATPCKTKSTMWASLANCWMTSRR